ncbi:hypothetical protein GLOIN_2v1776561 [Rhizophagus irregularis DAOM 181602=DAOM 197198]|uniref:Uncharacterized protein n=1 Tax=Rhizophagus irregularis (strain DAOM 181602 / DAOM 197198 / MUCL 43194) TaxID=747089 RepID=A0A2P4PWV1_RHIID|nr:hypothetical protein GLOIN_2v1776561 [Rhizophagus irregularis DAOM 181602=DAOM 197198]POG69863.1 hypothetical protein GLOIN_2v1776561 [Rhizophagus irregularis DAOM 181602=DAOM 197198]GET58388.1 hypothetical protein GLOIN_2v1776561 [Rhizophagus irregularis DAOM 181602=DAOM 197198]CAG8751451.1 15452_t:CDS:2 [Rhizophagus irregularis]|eukprot:XP_025176729.1 hypothetical protein GLOIN_2v1776561 [Rhizophagus irregularis DAOM 181602=DAOM 197198]
MLIYCKEENHFDLTYLNIEPRYTLDQWTFVIGELIKVKQPDGYVEVQQITFESLEGTAGSKFLNSRHVKSWHVKTVKCRAPSLLSTNLCYFNLIINNISMDELKQLV